MQCKKMQTLFHTHTWSHPHTHVVAGLWPSQASPTGPFSGECSNASPAPKLRPASSALGRCARCTRYSKLTRVIQSCNHGSVPGCACCARSHAAHLSSLELQPFEPALICLASAGMCMRMVQRCGRLRARPHEAQMQRQVQCRWARPSVRQALLVMGLPGSAQPCVQASVLSQQAGQILPICGHRPVQFTCRHCCIVDGQMHQTLLHLCIWGNP